MISIPNPGKDSFPSVPSRSAQILRRDPGGSRSGTAPEVHSGADSKAPVTEIAANLHRAAHRLRGLLASHFNEFGLTDVRFAVLQILQNSSTAGCTQAELAAALDQSESSVSALVERMRDDNLLYRLRSKTDRRKRVLILTEQARELLERVEQDYEERVSKLVGSLTNSQLVELACLLRALVDELSRAEPAVAPKTDSSSAPSPHFDSIPQSSTTPEQAQHLPVA